MVFEQREQHSVQWTAIESVAVKIGCTAQTLLSWVKQPETDNRKREGVTIAEAEREEITLLRAQALGGREIDRRIWRNPSTVSRELTRNAATPGAQVEYRASVAQRPT